MTETHRCFVVSTQFNNLLPEQNPTRYSDEQILDLSRFDAAPLIALSVTKETDYRIETDGRIPPRCSADCTVQRAYPQTGGWRSGRRHVDVEQMDHGISGH